MQQHAMSFPSAAIRRPQVAVFATLVFGLLAGCAAPPGPDIVGSVPDDYRVTHPITLAEKVETMDIPVGIDTARLPVGFNSTVAGFGQRFIASGSGVMAIVSPVDSPNEIAAASVSHQIRDTLIASGVGAREIEFRGYKAGPDERGAPVRLAFNRIAAETDACGRWPKNVALSGDNRNYENFGCATQQNLAAMVENPLDLLYPRGITPSDPNRLATVLKKYRQGDVYESSTPQTGGTVAKGVGN
jgi:pilus assembly protein CpaD